jgi:hypothetical protein
MDVSSAETQSKPQTTWTSNFEAHIVLATLKEKRIQKRRRAKVPSKEKGLNLLPIANTQHAISRET